MKKFFVVSERIVMRKHGFIFYKNYIRLIHQIKQSYSYNL